MTIHDDAWNGTLQGAVLENYIKSDPTLIDSEDPKKGIPPLSAAVIRGHVNVVEELLNKGAQADKLSKRGETPLLLAAWRTSKNRPRIIQLLLTKTPKDKVDLSCEHAEKNTPLMFILLETRPIDYQSIRLLVKAGASLTVKNADGLDAERIARITEDDKAVQALHPEKEGFDLSKLVDLIVSFLLFIISWVNSGAVNDVVKGVVGRLHKFNPALDQDINKAVNAAAPPQNKDDFVANIDNYVKDTPLEKFFPKDSKFIQTLAEKAVDLKDDPTTPLGSPSLMKKTILVSMHQQVLYCDDSGSMVAESRFDNLKQLVRRITRTTTRILPDNEGVALRFINQNVPNSTNLTLDQIDNIITPMQPPKKGTAIGTNLKKKILEPLVYEPLNAGTLKRPLLVIVITDGEPTEENANTFVDAIVECGDRLSELDYPRESVKFLVSQIGTAKVAEKFLQDLKQEPRIEGNVFVTSDQLDTKFTEFKGNEGKMDRWLIETLFSPIGRSLEE